MPEPCRNFQRGSCRYGDRCRFSHATQQQQKTNPFGFGSQIGSPFQQQSGQQQKHNPFGFGTQNNNKPFENKWIRPGQQANQPQATQSQSANHECKDPSVCKRLITEDFQNERPLWKLTCYAHYKHLPCDVSGDISYEELRAEAYNGAKSGLSIQAIVEREKNLEKSKLTEYENMLRNPYTQNTSVQSNPSPFPTVENTTTQNTGPSPFFGFPPQQGSSPNMTFGITQQGPSPNMTFGIPQQGSSPNNTSFPSSTPQNNPAPGFAGFSPQGSSPNNTSFPSSTPQNNPAPGFAVFSPQGSSPHMSFGVRPSTPSNNAFGPSQSSGPFGVSSGPFGTQVPTQTGGNSFPVQTNGNSSSTTIFGNGGMNSQGNQTPAQTGGNAFASNIPQFGQPSLPVSSQLNQTPVTSQPSVLSNGLTNTNSLEKRNVVQKELLPVDASIWLKSEWKTGEIPEVPPPEEYVK